MTIELLRSTGDQRIDDILLGTLGLLDAMLPGRMRGAYLTGSLVDGTATDGSDIDVLIVLKGTMSEDDEAVFRRIRLDGSRLAGRFLDVAPDSEAALFTEGRPLAKAATFDLIWGEETKDRWAIESVEASLHHPMRGSYFYLGHFRGSTGPLVYPLSYPDPNGEFFGYERRGYHDLDGWISAGTKAFIGGMTLAASVIVAIRAGELPATLRQSLVPRQP
jgi:predicted nucleotidyltransferase